MTTLRDVALRKVREGISTFDQVIDVTAAH
jgi:hypothetical protein